MRWYRGYPEHARLTGTLQSRNTTTENGGQAMDFDPLEYGKNETTYVHM